MNRDALNRAIQKAIGGGAELAAPIPGSDPSTDTAFIRTQTEAGWRDQAVFDQLITDLWAIPEIAALATMHASSPIGTLAVNIGNLARLLVARAIATGDIEGTVAEFSDYLGRNSAPALAVMAVSGVKTNSTISLGPNVRLIPLDSLPRSTQRGAALAQRDVVVPFVQTPIASALVADFDFGPVFGRRGGTDGPKAYAQALEIRRQLEEARLLLGLLNIYPTFRMFWVQPKNLLMGVGLSAGWQFESFSDDFQRDLVLNSGEVEPLARNYFEIDEKLRQKILHIPLDRLSRAGREQDLADRAIDLGIALEALLLHDSGDTRERGELKFRLSLRGAWLLGKDEKERAEVFRILRESYDLRSRAVHSGVVEVNLENRQALTSAIIVCQRLIKAVVTAKCKVDWQKIVLGALRQ